MALLHSRSTNTLSTLRPCRPCGACPGRQSAGSHPRALEHVGERRAGELCALAGVEHLRTPEVCEHILQGLDTELAVEGIGRHGRVDGAQRLT